MGQFSAEKPVAPGSVLSGNQQNVEAKFFFDKLRGENFPEIT
jgi:hypothetical protein